MFGPNEVWKVVTKNCAETVIGRCIDHFEAFKGNSAGLNNEEITPGNYVLLVESDDVERLVNLADVVLAVKF